MMDDSRWGMFLGKSGKIPGEIDPELVELAKKQGREFTDVDAHTLLTNALDDFIQVAAEDDSTITFDIYWRHGDVKMLIRQRCRNSITMAEPTKVMQSSKPRFWSI